MRAGSGVTHSEFNPSKAERLHFLQIWIVPDARNLKPAYDELNIDDQAARESFVLLGSRDGRDGSLQIHQDVDLWMTLVHANDSRVYSLGSRRHAWIHVARGEAVVNDIALAARDGLAITAETKISVGGALRREPAEILLFDLA